MYILVFFAGLAAKVQCAGGYSSLSPPRGSPSLMRPLQTGGLHSSSVAQTSISSPMLLEPVEAAAKGEDPTVSQLKQAESAGSLSLELVERTIFKVARNGSNNNWCLIMEIYGRFAKGALSSVLDHNVKSSFYEKLLTIMMKCNGQVHLFLLLSDALGQGIVPTDSTLTYLLLALSEKGEISIMTAIIDQVSRFEGAVVSNKAFMALLNACERTGSYDTMLELYYSKMEPTMIDFVAVGILLKACNKLRRPEAAVDIFEGLLDAYSADGRFFEEIPSSVIERVMAILVKDGAGELAVRVLLQLEMWQEGAANIDDTGDDDDKEDYDLSEKDLINIVSKLITSYESRENHAGAEVSEKASAHDTFLHVSYEDLDVIERGTIQLLGTDAENLSSDHEEPEKDNPDMEAEFEATLRMLIEMNRAPLASHRVYAGAVSALSKSGRAVECKALLDSYIARGGEPTEEMYTSTIYAHRYSRNMTAAEEILQALKQSSGIDVTIASFNAFLLAHAASGTLPNHRKRVLTEIREMGLHLTRESYTALIMGAGSSERSALWREMVHEKGITPTIASVKEVLKMSSGDMALEILQYLWTLPSPPKVIKASKKDYSSRLRQGRRNGPRGAVWNTPTSTRGADRHQKSAPPKWQTIKQQQQQRTEEDGYQRSLVRPRWEVQKLQPSVEIVNLALSSLAAENRTEDVLLLINRMREKEIEPTLKSYRLALVAFSHDSADWRSAIQLLIQMQTKGMVAGLSKALMVAVSCCRQGQRYDLIKKLTAQACLSDRFYVSPAMVEHIVLAGFHLDDSSWLTSTLARRRPLKEGEEEPVLCLNSLVGGREERCEALESFIVGVGAGIKYKCSSK